MSDERLTYSEFVAEFGNRAIRKHYEEIVERFFESRRDPESICRRGSTPLQDVLSLVGYLGLMLDENDRLIYFLLRSERDGRIGRQEICRLMGLRDE